MNEPFPQEIRWMMALLLMTAASAVLAAALAGRAGRKRQREREERQRQKGEEGELGTALMLLKVSGYKRLLHHVYVPTADGRGTTEIDLVMVHEKGIIVIENKNYKGYIYGSEEDLYWTQAYREREKRNFYNPVKQNQGHIRHLRRLLDSHFPEPIPYWSVITFNSGGILKRVRVRRETAMVISSSKVKKCLRKRLRWKPRVLNKGQVDEICRFLQKEAGDTRKARKMLKSRYIS